MKYIDAEKLKSIIRLQINERKEWLKDIDRSDRQDQLFSDLNGEDMSILQIIDSLQQEQPEVDLDADIEMEWDSFNKHLAEYGEEAEEVVWLNWNSFEDIARHFFELGKEDMKAKMMEVAVDADVMLTLHDKTSDVSIHTSYLPKDLGIKCDSKVKVIVIKEEEK